MSAMSYRGARHPRPRHACYGAGLLPPSCSLRSSAEGAEFLPGSSGTRATRVARSLRRNLRRQALTRAAVLSPLVSEGEKGARADVRVRSAARCPTRGPLVPPLAPVLLLLYREARLHWQFRR
ncbi:hypothetical protein MTO96_011395 [Rhipicephalus appendiculatus]